MPNVAQQREAEIGPVRRRHEGPERRYRRVPTDVDLAQIEQRGFANVGCSSQAFRNGSQGYTLLWHEMVRCQIVHRFSRMTKSPGINHLCPRILTQAEENSVRRLMQPRLVKTARC